MKCNPAKKKSHAVLDLPSRHLKALKIERLLELRTFRQPMDVLEIGTGSGGIAHYFAAHQRLACKVTAVDISDQRLVKGGYDFIEVKSVMLPFKDRAFDVVITNHVIEHVGVEAEQRNHLNEVRRVMRPTGVGYLAVPNRWMLIEPHYRLIFLSWLPPAWRTLYLRIMKRGNEYDCNPLSLSKIEEMLKDARFLYKSLSTCALRETLRIEGSKGLFDVFGNALPDAMLNFLTPINPTLIYKLSRE